MSMQRSQVLHGKGWRSWRARRAGTRQGESRRCISKLGSGISVLDMLALGSTMSVRSFNRVGSSMSIYGL